MPTNNNINAAKKFELPLGSNSLNGHLKPFTLDRQGFQPQFVVNTGANVGNEEIMAWCPTNQNFYVADVGGSVRAFDPITNTIVATISVGTSPTTCVYCPSNDRIYTANANSANISVINPLTNVVVATISVGSTPVYLTYCPSNDRIYVPCILGNVVSVINPQTNAVGNTISGITNPWGSAYIPTLDYIAIGTQGGSYGPISYINSKTDTVVITPSQPQGRYITYCPSNDCLYFANDTTFVLYKISMKDFSILKQWGPFGQLYYPGYNPTRDLIYVPCSNGGPNRGVFTFNPHTDESKVIANSLDWRGSANYCPLNNRMYILTSGPSAQVCIFT